MITFEVADVEVAKGERKRDVKSVQDAIRDLTSTDLWSKKGVIVEACNAVNTDKLIGRLTPTMPNARSLEWYTTEKQKQTYIDRIMNAHDDHGSINGFLRAAYTAFAEHLPLTLSPDHIWIAIAQGFAHHVNDNSDKLRKAFVAHEDKKRINIQRDHFVKGSKDNDWQEALSEFSNQIADHIGKKHELLVSNFSTTNIVERAVSEIVLMDTLQTYFEYMAHTCCGIPSITLLGTTEDWEQIRIRAEVLVEFDCFPWVRNLGTVLHQFVRASKNDIDKNFWSSFYNYDGRSGGPYITGAINVFFPYLTIGKGAKTLNPNAWEDISQKRRQTWGGGPTLDKFPRGLSKVPFIWNYYNQELPYNLFGGFVGVKQDEATRGLEPVLGWGVAEEQ